MSLARASNAIAASFVVAMSISSKSAEAEGEVGRVDAAAGWPLSSGFIQEIRASGSHCVS